jgi:hypothetical protein
MTAPGSRFRSCGCASYEDAVVCIQIAVGPLRLSAEGIQGQFPSSISIKDGSTIGSTDQYIINQSGLEGDFGFFLLSLTGDPGQNGIQGTQLQDTPPPLSEFDNSTNLQFVIPTMPLSSSVKAELTLLVRAAEQPPLEEPFLCPEPGSDLLALSCLGSLALLRRRGDKRANKMPPDRQETNPLFRLFNPL